MFHRGILLHKTEYMMKKRVGIITILRVNNYGAELQAYATQRIMNLMGYDAEIIDYLYYRNREHIREHCSMPFYPYPLKNRIKEWVLRLLDTIEQYLRSDVNERRMTRFCEFHNQFNRFSTIKYQRYSELFANPPLYDAYCVGSDQVWNPRCYTNLYPYFLKFAPDESIKFSYASSFGVSSLPDLAKDRYLECLNNLTSISVRESQGRDIVKQITGKDAVLVADPTLLLDKQQWEKVEKHVSNIPQRYVLVYELRKMDRVMETAIRVSEKLDCSIVRICKNTSSAKDIPGIVNIIDAGPSEFIYLFNHATFVVTNSFHGTAFSINFKKDFYCVLSKKATNNSRQIGLLNLCGMSDRIVYDNQPVDSIGVTNIDYTQASKALEEFKNKSIEYIRKAIDGTE